MKKNTSSTIIISPKSQINSTGFYILGLRNLFAKVSFSEKPFTNLENSRHFIFQIKDGDLTKNVVIDYDNSRKINKKLLEWCDLYAKINLHSEISFECLRSDFSSSDDFLKHSKKVMSIPPGFGIRIFGLFQLIGFVGGRLLTQSPSKSLREKEFYRDVLSIYVKRRQLSIYAQSSATSNYVYLVASIWHKTTSYVNVLRAEFIRVCKSNPKINFEGGLVDIGYECDYIEDLESLKTHSTKTGLEEYIKKTKKSYFVFNTPSVEYWHGWKLAEYLCLGKAIISTPLSNELPEDLVHGENIHFTAPNQNSIAEAVDYLMANPASVSKLEKGAADYWEKYGKPERVIERIVQKLFKANQDI